MGGKGQIVGETNSQGGERSGKQEDVPVAAPTTHIVRHVLLAVRFGAHVDHVGPPMAHDYIVRVLRVSCPSLTRTQACLQPDVAPGRQYTLSVVLV